MDRVREKRLGRGHMSWKDGISESWKNGFKRMKFLEPIKALDKTKFLEFSYMLTLAILLLAVVFTPVFIRHHLLFSSKYAVKEDVAETVLISILLLIAFILSKIYKKELNRYRRKTRISTPSLSLRLPIAIVVKYRRLKFGTSKIFGTKLVAWDALTPQIMCNFCKRLTGPLRLSIRKWLWLVAR